MNKIIVNELNKLRWACPNQSFTSNVLRPQTQEEFDLVINFLNQRNISYTITDQTSFNQKPKGYIPWQ